LKPPPPASGPGPANNGTGASASQDHSDDLSGTLFFVRRMCPQGSSTASPRTSRKRSTGRTSHGLQQQQPLIESSINQINPGGGSSWRIFSSGIFPRRCSARTRSATRRRPTPGFGNLLNPTGETPPPVPEPAVPPATPEQPAPPAPVDGQNPPASDQPKSGEGTEPSGDDNPAASRD